MSQPQSGLSRKFSGKKLDLSGGLGRVNLISATEPSLFAHQYERFYAIYHEQRKLARGLRRFKHLLLVSDHKQTSPQLVWNLHSGRGGGGGETRVLKCWWWALARRLVHRMSNKTQQCTLEGEKSDWNYLIFHIVRNGSSFSARISLKDKKHLPTR